MKDNKNKIISKNLGLQLLRTILSFWVIIFHCCRVKNKILKTILIRSKLHVPTFMIISFYFLYPIISNRKINKIKERIYRLYIPFLFYPLLIWMLNNLLYILFKSNSFNKKISIKELIIQLLVGRPIIPVLWFHCNLLVLTILFTIFSLIFNKYFLILSEALGILSYIIQYSGLNYKFFLKYQAPIQLSLGYIFEIIPISVTGFYIASIKLIEKLQKYKYSNLYLCLNSLFFLIKYHSFNDAKGFNFQGIIKNLCSVLLFIFFTLLPFENLKNKLVISVIKHITSYTGGIYYIHIIARNYLKKNIRCINKGTFYGAILIYILCYIICYIGNKIFGKTQLKHLFI